jgi:hypothetical protein
MTPSLRAAIQSVAIGCVGGLIAAGGIASWHAAQTRDAVCRAAVASVMDLNSGSGHIDPDSSSSWLSAPEVDLLVVTGDASAVHGARCGFSSASLVLPQPVLRSLAIDDLLISPIRLKLLGIALGVYVDPQVSSPKSG